MVQQPYRSRHMPSRGSSMERGGTSEVTWVGVELQQGRDQRQSTDETYTCTSWDGLAVDGRCDRSVGIIPVLL